MWRCEGVYMQSKIGKKLEGMERSFNNREKIFFARSDSISRRNYIKGTDAN